MLEKLATCYTSQTRWVLLSIFVNKVMCLQCSQWKLSMSVLMVLKSSPAKAAAVDRGGEEKLRLAQSKALRNPRPDVVHLFGPDDFRGECVRVQG